MLEPKLAASSTDTSDPNRPQLCSENCDPILLTERRLRDDPISAKFNMLKLLPKVTLLNIDIEEPKRLAERSESAEPKLNMSSTLKQAARDVPKMDICEPKLPSIRMDNAEPALTKLRTERLLPNRAELNRLMLDPLRAMARRLSVDESTPASSTESELPKTPQPKRLIEDPSRE
jgi:hypothetical protein